MIKEIIWLFLGLGGAYLSLVRAFQMLQQNSYFASRYCGWLKSSFSVLSCIIKVIILALIIAAAVFGESTFTASMLLFSVLAVYFGWRGFSENGKSIKKLVLSIGFANISIFSVRVRSLPT